MRVMPRQAALFSNCKRLFQIDIRQAGGVDRVWVIVDHEPVYSCNMNLCDGENVENRRDEQIAQP